MYSTQSDEHKHRYSEHVQTCIILSQDVFMCWNAWPDNELANLLLGPESPDHPLAELDVDARDKSEGNRFMIRNCSINLLTQAEITSSLLSS